jgi:hypothetical protein
VDVGHLHIPASQPTLTTSTLQGSSSHQPQQVLRNTLDTTGTDSVLSGAVASLLLPQELYPLISKVPDWAMR